VPDASFDHLPINVTNVDVSPIHVDVIAPDVSSIHVEDEPHDATPPRGHLPDQRYQGLSLLTLLLENYLNPDDVLSLMFFLCLVALLAASYFSDVYIYLKIKIYIYIAKVRGGQ